MISVFAAGFFPEIQPGDDLGLLIGDALDGVLEDGDILAVTSKIVSKAEGRQVAAADREDAITAETVRVVATRHHARGTTRIVQNRLGLVMAAAGVDASNTPDGVALLLPVDPDASARRLCSVLRERFGIRIGVVITDTFGRPWREGQTDAAIGASGIRVLADLRGTPDAQGRRLDVTVSAVADEIAAAADLVKGKTSGNPVAVVRGLSHFLADLEEPGAHALVRPASEDMFSRGSHEAWNDGYAAALASVQAPGGSEGVSDKGAAAWDVVIPVKGTDAAKSRLAGESVQRRATAMAIAIDTVNAVKAAANVHKVVVVTSPEAAPSFERLQVGVVVESGERAEDGLNAAVALGLRSLAEESKDSPSRQGVAVLLGDLPALQPSELVDALRFASRYPRAMVPDADGVGTVLLAAAPGFVHFPAFGTNSRHAHLAAGYVEVAMPASSGLRRDVDTLEQLAACSSLGTETKAIVEKRS